MSETHSCRMGPNVLVRDAAELRFIPVREIIRVEAAEGACTLHTADGMHSTRRSVDEMEHILGPDFLRLRRSSLVHVIAIVGMTQRSDGRLDARLTDGSGVVVSRSRSIELRRLVL